MRGSFFVWFYFVHELKKYSHTFMSEHFKTANDKCEHVGFHYEANLSFQMSSLTLLISEVLRS